MRQLTYRPYNNSQTKVRVCFGVNLYKTFTSRHILRIILRTHSQFQVQNICQTQKHNDIIRQHPANNPQGANPTYQLQEFQKRFGTLSLLCFPRNDTFTTCHCEEHSDEAISIKTASLSLNFCGLTFHILCSSMTQIAVLLTLSTYIQHNIRLTKGITAHGCLWKSAAVWDLFALNYRKLICQ